MIQINYNYGKHKANSEHSYKNMFSIQCNKVSRTVFPNWCSAKPKGSVRNLGKYKNLLIIFLFEHRIAPFLIIVSLSYDKIYYNIR